MEQATLVLTIAVMFVVRLGIPVLTLVLIGVLIDRIQSRREKHLPHINQTPSFR
jgi:hypothetical protein